VLFQNEWQKKGHTLLQDALYIPPKATFNASTSILGPIINVVPVSTTAYVNVLILVDPTLTLFKTSNQSEKKGI
jgi:hypothetical protein